MTPEGTIDAGAFQFSEPKGPIKFKYRAGRDGEDFAEEAIIGPVDTSKTTMVLDFMLRRGFEYPGSNILIARGTLTNLKGSSLQKMEQRFGPIFKDDMNRNEGIYRFPWALNPYTQRQEQSVIKAIGLDRVDLEYVLKSTEFSTVVLEEANEIPSLAHDVVQERSRQKIFHYRKKVKDLCMALGQQWGISAQEVFDILRADRTTKVGQYELDWESPMPGNTVVKAVWNPMRDDHTWQRYVGLDYPRPHPTEDWVERHVGIREVHVEPEELRASHTILTAGAIIKMPDGTRRISKLHREDGVVELINPTENGKSVYEVNEIHEKNAGVIMQRNCIYCFPWENWSRDYQNDLNSYLMVNRSYRNQAFLGATSLQNFRIFPTFRNEYAEHGGHLLPWPGKKNLARRGLPGLGGIDQGGSHATVILMAVYLPRKDTIIIYDEYIRQGLSARASAEDAKAMILPGMRSVTWGYDPQMDARRFDKDNEYRVIMEYQETLGEGNLYPGIRGQDGFDLVNTYLESHDNFINGIISPKLFVFDNLFYVPEALKLVTKKMIESSRDNELVDVADCLKYLVSVANQAVTYNDVDLQAMLKPNLAFSNEVARGKQRIF